MNDLDSLAFHQARGETLKKKSSHKASVMTGGHDTRSRGGRSPNGLRSSIPYIPKLKSTQSDQKYGKKANFTLARPSRDDKACLSKK